MYSDLSIRMKIYESATRTYLPPRSNMVIRVDGRAFHTYTRGCKTPFDDDLMAAMDATAIALCEEVQGAKLGYVQSDEITVWATSYDNLGSMPWFGGSIQKMTSIAASVATARFNQYRLMSIFMSAEVQHMFTKAADHLAHFDARVWTIPELAEVANMFKWRADDASRNSVQMVARSLYSHRELEGKSTSELHDLIHTKGQNWNDLAPRYKRGRLVKRVDGKWEICDLTDFTWQYWMGIINEVKPCQSI